MKHIHKYIFATIIILLFTSTLQSAPKAFDSLGDELEALQKDCKKYLKDPKIFKKLKATCKKFNAKVNKAFKVGYPLDASVESDTADEKKTGRYLALLRKADESGESLREFKRSREKKERKAKSDKYIDKYKKACDAGDAKKCYELGLMFYEGQKIEKNRKEAARLFRKACDANSAKGCNALGYMLGHGNGVKKDKVKAYKFTSKACDGGDAEGCFNLGLMYDEGRGVKQDDFKAKEFFGKACDGGDAEGCKHYSILSKRKKENRSKTKAPKLILRVWGKRSHYWGNEFTAYTIGQVCPYVMRKENYQGSYNVHTTREPMVAGAFLDNKASKQAGSIKYKIVCNFSKKDGKLINNHREINKRVSKHGILKVVQDECEFYPDNNCRPIR